MVATIGAPFRVIDNGEGKYPLRDIANNCREPPTIVANPLFYHKKDKRYTKPSKEQEKQGKKGEKRVKKGKRSKMGKRGKNKNLTKQKRDKGQGTIKE
jgi:hypothetical protein